MAKGATAHICILCEHPVATYGRLWPCLHTYCLTCAAGLDKCSLCVLCTTTRKAHVCALSCHVWLLHESASLKTVSTTLCRTVQPDPILAVLHAATNACLCCEERLVFAAC